MADVIYETVVDALYCEKHDHLDLLQDCSYTLEPQTAADNRKPIPVTVTITAVRTEVNLNDIT